MKSSSLTENITYKADKPNVEMLLDTDFTKEIRITFKKGQLMKEHIAPQAIVVEVFDGAIEFRVKGEKHSLKRGDILTLKAKVPHDLLALEDSIVRLTLSKGDAIERVEKVVS